MKKDREESKEENKQKYFICPNCADLTTWFQILKECGVGGQGMCMCGWGHHFWNDKYQEMDYETDRLYVQYIEISKHWFKILKGEKNNIIRLRVFNQIPKDKRMENFDENKN